MIANVLGGKMKQITKRQAKSSFTVFNGVGVRYSVSMFSPMNLYLGMQNTWINNKVEIIKAVAGQVWECSKSGSGYKEGDLITIGSPEDNDPLYFRAFTVGYKPEYLKRWISESYLNKAFKPYLIKGEWVKQCKK